MTDDSKPEHPRSATLARVIRRTLAGPTRFETWHIPALIEGAKQLGRTLDVIEQELTDGQD